MGKKYKLVTVKENGIPVTRLKALRDGKWFNKGDLGARIVDPEVFDMSQDDESWADYKSELTNCTIKDSDVIIFDSKCTDLTINRSIGKITVSTISGGLYANSAAFEIVFSTLTALVTLSNSSNTKIASTEIKKPCKVTGNTEIRGSGIATEDFQKIPDKHNLHPYQVWTIDSMTVELIDSRIYNSRIFAHFFASNTEIFGTDIVAAVNINDSTLTNVTVYGSKQYVEKSSLPTISNAWFTGGNIEVSKTTRCASCSDVNINDWGACRLNPGHIVAMSNSEASIARIRNRGKWYIMDKIAGEQMDFTDESLYETLGYKKSPYRSLAPLLLSILATERIHKTTIRLRILLVTICLRNIIEKRFHRAGPGNKPKFTLKSRFISFIRKLACRK